MFHQGFSRQGEKYENDPEVGINLPSEFKKKKNHESQCDWR